jgi:hypothetical protein
VIATLVLLAQAQAAAPPVRATVSTAPAIVTIGEPFVVTVTLVAPAGVALRVPVAVDSTAQVEPLDPVAPGAVRPDGAVDWTIRYRAAAWDTGTVSVPLGPVVVGEGAAAIPRALPAARVRVRPLVPLDTAAQAPRPARAFLPFGDRRPWYAIAAAVLALAVALAVWGALRRRRALRAPDPYGGVEASFDRLDRLALAGAGEAGRHAALAADILRDYLVARGTGPAGITLARLAEAGDPAVPARRLAAFAARLEAVRYARAPLDVAQAQALAAEARALARAVRDADRAQERAS